MLEVFEIGVVGVPLCYEVKEQLSAGEGSRAQKSPREALIAGEGFEGHNSGILAEQIKDPGKA